MTFIRSTSSRGGVLFGCPEATEPCKALLGRAVQVQHNPETGVAASATLRASRFERSVAAAIFVAGPATAELEACILRDTASSQQGFLGDGLVVWSDDGPASAAVTATRIEGSARAAVSSFGATVALESSLLVRQSFDIGAESWQGKNSVFDNRGGALCGCPEATEPCKAQSYALEPHRRSKRSHPRTPRSWCILSFHAHVVLGVAGFPRAAIGNEKCARITVLLATACHRGSSQKRTEKDRKILRGMLRLSIRPRMSVGLVGCRRCVAFERQSLVCRMEERERDVASTWKRRREGARRQARRRRRVTSSIG